MTIWTIFLWLLGLMVALQLVLTVTITVLNKRRKERREPYTPIPLPELDIPGASLNIYMEGDTLFYDMLAAIENAKETIYFETFIWHNDEIGQQFIEAFIKKAEEGIQVYLIYDWIGNSALGGSRLKFPETPNLHVMAFFPITRPRHLFNPARWSVTHRKMLIVDKAIGFVGGYNIGKEYMYEWRDTHLRFSGAGVDGLEYAFVDFWNVYRTKRLPELPYPKQDWRANIQAYRNDPLRHNYPIRSLYLEAVERASHSIIMTTAYFVPDPSLRRAILTAAKRGVQVEILIPWRSNHAIADWIARCKFSEYLDSGVHIHAYNGSMIHAKTVTVDGIWSMLGTANIDRLSLGINHEVNVEIFDEAVAVQMEQIFAADLRESRNLDAERWRGRPLAWRFGELILRPLWPLM